MSVSFDTAQDRLRQARDEREEVSRRGVLGAAVGLSFDTGLRRAQPLLRMNGGEAVGPLHRASHGPPPRSGEDWEAALAAFEAAKTRVRGIEAATAGCGFEEEEALLPAHDAACAAMAAAVRRMLLLPAPNLGALGVKLELFFEHALDPHSVEEDVLAGIRGDVRRIAALA